MFKYQYEIIKKAYHWVIFFSKSQDLKAQMDSMYNLEYWQSRCTDLKGRICRECQLFQKLPWTRLIDFKIQWTSNNKHLNWKHLRWALSITIKSLHSCKGRSAVASGWFTAMSSDSYRVGTNFTATESEQTFKAIFSVQ